MARFSVPREAQRAAFAESPPRLRRRGGALEDATTSRSPDRAALFPPRSLGNGAGDADAVGMIVEGLATTRTEAGGVTLAPLGAVWPHPGGDLEGDAFLLRPFEGSATCANLLARRSGVWHVVDDAALIARAVLAPIAAPTVPVGDEVRLTDCCRWLRFAVREIDGPDDRGRYELAAVVRERGTVRPARGLNRAAFALVEGAILATRTFLMSREEVNRRLADLAPLIDKTGTPADAAAWAELTVAIAARPSLDDAGAGDAAAGGPR